jgi:TatD DNase family protein
MLTQAVEPLVRAREAGVVGMVCVGTDLPTSHHAVEIADRHPDVWATVGLHPHDASRLAAEWGQLEMLAHAEPVVAIGEAGFDLYYEHSPKDEQETAFRWQIRLAHRLDLALVIHTRDAWDDTFRILDREGTPRRTVFHCFTGGPDEAAGALTRGALLSISGIVTFKSATDVRAAVASTPIERLLVETDSPYLAPVPHRGKPNRPAWVPLVGAALATLKGCTVAEVEAVTWTNTCSFYRLDPLAG